ncbi:MAG: carbohydrate binding family 9 domain-containing protein [Lewinellaceae bacterium]|nr:carbohydrate binding family 9 domain-containing protein [Lewinellaceae bacterium]MCB9295717.1 carbohydrate binding family 9 domain-containing protein [Lewinellaceae bacterium]
MYTHTRLALLFFMLTFFLVAQGQDNNFPPPDTPVVIRAAQAVDKITIDGKLDERAWQRATPVTDFFRMEPRQGGDYQYHTSVQILFDERNLYVGAFCTDSMGRNGIRVQDLRRDFTWGENDIFGIQLDPQNLRQYCVSFQATPYGSQRDLQNFNDNNTDNDWNALWAVRTTRTDTGYYAEFAIPFKSLRYELPEKGDSSSWGITFTRLARRDYEQTVFPPIPQSFSPYRMTYAAELRGLTLPKPSTNIRAEPYTLYQYDRLTEGANTTAKQQPKIGGDIKWAITPKSVMDFTFNTDFAQADVDRAVNNLERFNIFFPERRQFFLENSGIWAGANNRSVVPFFSRRIGLQGNFNAEPAPIHAGARYTSRNEQRAIAGLYMHQAETDRSPGASFAVARYQHNYGKENNAGVMLTHRMDEASEALGLEASHNSTLTLDGLVRPRDEFTLSYMLSGSRDNANDTLGIGGRIFAGYSTNDFYLGWLTNFVSDAYRPDMGFVFQENVIYHNPGGYFIWRPRNIPWIRRFDPGAFVNYYHDFKNPGNFQQANLYLFPIYLIFTNGSFLEYAIFPTWQNINFSFAPLGVPIEQDSYYYTRQQVRFNTDQSARLSGSGSINWGRFYNGRRTSLNAGLRYAPSVHAAITVDYEYNDLTNLGIGQTDLSTHLVSVGTRFALNPRLQLSSFYQYNSFDKQGRWNLRFSWEYQPLSFLYIVFNDARINDLDDPFQEQQVISKITFVKQF